jgi:hypothetical protein
MNILAAMAMAQRSLCEMSTTYTANTAYGKIIHQQHGGFLISSMSNLWESFLSQRTLLDGLLILLFYLPYS